MCVPLHPSFQMGGGGCAVSFAPISSGQGAGEKKPPLRADISIAVASKGEDGYFSWGCRWDAPHGPSRFATRNGPKWEPRGTATVKSSLQPVPCLAIKSTCHNNNTCRLCLLETLLGGSRLPERHVWAFGSWFWATCAHMCHKHGFCSGPGLFCVGRDIQPFPPARRGQCAAEIQPWFCLVK